MCVIPTPPHIGKKWKRLSLAEFAREFEMQEMEKQAYLLSQVSMLYVHHVLNVLFQWLID